MKRWILIVLVGAVFTFAGLGRTNASALGEEPWDTPGSGETGEPDEIFPNGSADTRPVRGKQIEAIRRAIKEKLGTLSIHGGVVGYYQGRGRVNIGSQEFPNPDGVGFAADVELLFEPIQKGEVFLRLHTGEGDGADKDLEDVGALFADLNTVNDDNPEDTGIDLLDVFYTHAFLDQRLLFSAGKTEPLVFIDDNAFANDEYAQFVGKPFVNNPVLDSENEYAPLVALRISPLSQLAFTCVFQSSSRPLLEEDEQKSAYDNIFEKPFLAGQITYSLAPGSLSGNYRVYAWAQTYIHPRLTGLGGEEGWGVGLSVDQMIHERVGLFARLGYQNEEVYEVPWSWSVGTSIEGIIPGRGDDRLGMAAAGLKANQDLENDGTEYHLESYYRLAHGEHLAVSADLQYVIDPLGDSGNENAVVGMIRAEAFF